MCSIIGYLGSSISAQDLRAGFDKTISRGPDDTRMLHIGAATLGFHRLAIMGLHPEDAAVHAGWKRARVQRRDLRLPAHPRAAHR